MLNKLFWKARIALLALRWIPQINLGDRVWYKGKQYVVVNGVWIDLYRLGYVGRHGWFENDHEGLVPKVECKKVWTISNCLHSFKAGWRFYMGYWYDIWVRTGIKEWMRGCSIWPWPVRR